jgi:cellulose synthase/poly-beta-1,6-N-acetylglucosamine synthase-like glycosyltransferase
MSSHKAKLALLIAAHDEELVLGATVRSAIAAGMSTEHIYVVDDNSSDSTSRIARSLLPRENVCRVRRSGKGLALTKASKKFCLTERYQWIHIADADGAFSPDYFKVFHGALRVKNAAATGYVRSLPGRHISQYRVLEYTLGMEVHRRFQALFNVIPVIPGPTSCFRADVFARVNFANESLTEDFDVTLQIHRQKLGKIQFIPKAVAYTQDPRTVRDFTNQITRWNRGIMQGMKRHRIGLKASRIDAYLTYQVLQNCLLFVNYFIWAPYLAMRFHSVNVLASVFIYDVLITLAITLAVAARAKRWDILSAFPIIYGLRWLSLGVFLRAFVEVIVLRKFRVSSGAWESGAKGRRYVTATP